MQSAVCSRQSAIGLALASASPRRAELLRNAGFVFSIEPADVDESPIEDERPEDYVLRIAREKAVKVRAAHLNDGALVLGADTTVVVNGKMLAKPEDDEDAARMLRALSGVVHEVLTGVALASAAGIDEAIARTRVSFLPLSSEEIAWYVSTGEPAGKAGAYAIQGRAARFVDWIDGSWSNVVGLPIATVYQMLKRVGA
jgi:septum formation protein